MSWIRVHLHKYRVGKLFGKSGWALKDGSDNRVVLSSRELEKLLLDDKATLLFEDERWRAEVLHYRGRLTDREKQVLSLKNRAQKEGEVRKRLVEEAERKRRELERIKEKTKSKTQTIQILKRKAEKQQRKVA